MSAPTEIQRVHRSQVLVGDGSVAVQIQPGGQTSLEAADGLLDSLTVHQLPVLRVPPGRSEPVGRGPVIEAALADLAAGRHVQLVGATGVGRAAVARALAGRAAEANRPGAVLLAGSEAHTLESLYTRLSGLFFDTFWYRPDERTLREVTGRLGPSGLIVVTDCDLTGEESVRLIETFPQCRFLLTSTSPTLGSVTPGGVAASVHEVAPLTLADVDHLVAQVLGRELTAPEREQAQAAHRLAAGRAAALVACAAFLRRAAESPRPTDLVALPPDRQAELLLAGFDEPARRVVAALAAFGPAPVALFVALAEKTTRGAPETDQLAFSLAQAGLILESDEGYAVSEDAAAIAGPVSAQETSAIAERLRAAYDQAAKANGQRDVLGPPATFSLEVVRALVAARQWEPASRLARAASADAVAAGRVGPWSGLVSLGAQAAREAGLTDDLRYFLRQQHTDALLRDDIATAAAVALALTGLLHVGAPPAPALLTRLGHARRLLHVGRHLLMAGHGTGAVVTGIAVAAVAGTAVGLSQSPHAAPTPKPAAVTSAAAAPTPWQRPPGATAPTWTVAMSSTPLTPVAAGGGTVSAQFPVISGGITDPALRTQVETALQKPIQQVFASIAQRANAAKSAGIVNSGYGSGGQSFPSETTTVTQAGDLVSVVYHFGDPTGAGPGSVATLAVLVRKDNGTVIPQQGILAAAATTPAGAARLNAAVAALLPPAPGREFPPVAIGCAQSSGAGFVGPAIGVSATGLTFYISGEADACAGGTAVTVPYSRLTGLVNPLIVDLVAVKEGA